VPAIPGVAIALVRILRGESDRMKGRVRSLEGMKGRGVGDWLSEHDGQVIIGDIAWTMPDRRLVAILNLVVSMTSETPTGGADRDEGSRKEREKRGKERKTYLFQPS